MCSRSKLGGGHGGMGVAKESGAGEGGGMCGLGWGEGFGSEEKEGGMGIW